MAQRAGVLHVEPLPEAEAVEEVVAARHLGRGHVLEALGLVKCSMKVKGSMILKCLISMFNVLFTHLVADGADVGVPLELLGGGLGEAVDLRHRRATLYERIPAGLRLAPSHSETN